MLLICRVLRRSTISLQRKRFSVLLDRFMRGSLKNLRGSTQQGGKVDLIVPFLI
jgi:hypothetical protein